MALTQTQAMDGYILDSVGHFLDRNVKTQYDLFVSSTSSYPRPLVLRMGNPDDPSTTIYTPNISLNFLEATEANREYGVGAGATAWRHYSIVLYCYPSTNVDGSPSLPAALALQSFVKNALGTEFIKMVDFTVSTPSNLVYTSDLLQVMRVTDPMPRGTKADIAVERHRFDVHLSLRIPVTESLAT